MSDDTDIPETSILLRSDDVGTVEGRKITVNTSYEPPLDGTDNPMAEAEVSVSKQVQRMLIKHFFGYDWRVMVDLRGGVVGIKLDELMGQTLYSVINLKQFSDLDERLVVRVGGDLLSRIGLPTDKFSMVAYLSAKQRRHTFDFGKVQ